MLAAWRADTMLLLLWKIWSYKNDFQINDNSQLKIIPWAKGQFRMRFTLIWSCARVPQSYLLGFIFNKQKGNTESASWNAAARKSVFKVLLRYMLTCRIAGWEQEYWLIQTTKQNMTARGMLLISGADPVSLGAPVSRHCRGAKGGARKPRDHRTTFWC